MEVKFFVQSSCSLILLCIWTSCYSQIIPTPQIQLRDGCTPKKTIKAVINPMERIPLEECFFEHRPSAAFGAPASAPDREVLPPSERVTTTTTTTVAPPPAASTSETMYFSFLAFVAQIELSGTNKQADPSKSFSSDYCIDSIGRDTIYVSFNQEHQDFVALLQRIILQDNISPQDKLRKAYELLEYSDMNVEALYDAVVGVAFADPTISNFRKIDRWNVIPTKFFHANVIEQVVNIIKDASSGIKSQPKCIISDENSSGRSADPENDLWYFREDPLVNAQHAIWHTVHPSRGTALPRSDRRGELFYYFHHFLIARYNAERLSNGLDLVKSFPLNQNQVIDEGYVPNLRTQDSRIDFVRYYDERDPFLRFTDTRFFDNNVSVAELIKNRDLVMEAINENRLINGTSQEVHLSYNKGIDFLGDAVEPAAHIFSNPNLGNLHGSGHLIFASINNQTGDQETPGPMGDLDTAMRDPVFYRWHSMVDDIFKVWKAKLQPYRLRGGDYPLLYEDFSVLNFAVSSNSGTNKLQTYWNEKRHSFFGQSVQICGKHLDHEEFNYEISLESRARTNATVRIFMAPKYNKDGHRFTMEEQRTLFFVMDTFSIELEKPGVTTFKWSSTRSTLTADSKDETITTQSCGCGWPHHLLLPKGTPEGMDFDLFIMVTPGAFPHFFDQENALRKCDVTKRESQCRVAPLLCGFSGKKYPDIYPMGYPFDRRPYTKYNSIRGRFAVEYLEDYVEGVSNMGMAEVTITHKDEFEYEQINGS